MRACAALTTSGSDCARAHAPPSPPCSGRTNVLRSLSYVALSFGHSSIVDPWGNVLATAPEGECFVAADLDLSAQEEVRESLPSLANRRPEAYAWPQLAEMHA